MMNIFSRFGLFILFVALGFYAGNINSTLLGVDLTAASTGIVNLVKIGFWMIGLSILFNIKEVFDR